MVRPYFHEFADLMEQGNHATALDLSEQIGILSHASKVHLENLRGGRTEYTPEDPNYLRLDELLYTANVQTHYLSLKIRPELVRYIKNMRILRQKFNQKYDALYETLGNYEAVDNRIGNDVLDSATRLEDLLWDYDELNWADDTQDVHEQDQTYLTEIATFWRRYGGRQEHRDYEDVWQWVARRRLRTRSE